MFEQNADPKDLAEEYSVDGVDGAVDRGPQGAQQHVGPLRLVVPEDPEHRGGLYALHWILFTKCIEKSICTI